MSDVTQILSAIDRGDPRAAEELLPLVYDELRQLAAVHLAREKPGQTLQATALVHEAYLRLVGGASPPVATGGLPFANRAHFFAAAAEAMRRIIVDRARYAKTLKQGGGRGKLSLDGLDLAAPAPAIDVLALNEALERFQAIDPVKANLVKLRYFAGMTVPQAAEVLGISTTTADRYWSYARAWLHAELTKGDA